MAKSGATLSAEYDARADRIDVLIDELIVEGVESVTFGQQRFDLINVDKLEKLSAKYRGRARMMLRKTRFVVTSPRRL